MQIPGMSAVIHVATWHFRYLIPASVDTQATPPNPTFNEGVRGQGIDREKELQDILRQGDVRFRENQRDLEDIIRGGGRIGRF